jgi:putative tricarboxylic transport membrane protein
MGIIPGVGEFVSQFLAYSYAQRHLENARAVRQGQPGGADRVARREQLGAPAAMVPLLALGIPGEELTAMMLSVFYVHNVIPGPGLFQNQMDFVYGAISVWPAEPARRCAFLLVATKPLLKVMEIPERFLGMLILILSVHRGLYLRNSVADVAIAAAFGVVRLHPEAAGPADGRR